jgi:D-3-phosphoglycerate dehydrogenase
VSAWRITATPRQFLTTRNAVQHLVDSGCEFVDRGYGYDVADTTLAGNELVNVLADMDAAVVGGCQLSRSVIERLPKLKVLARRGVGYETVDIDAASDHGIIVTITPGANSNAVADHAMAMLLAVCRHILDGHRCVVEGKWRAFMGTELWGKTLGIIGLGRIGKRVALRARGFDMAVLAADPVHDDDFAAHNSVAYVPLDELLKRSDFVSVNAPLTPETHHLIDARTIALMKPSAILINTARAGLVNYAALESALREGHLAGAGIDVFDEEPPGVVSLAELPGVVLSPHTAGYSHEGIEMANLMAARSITEIMSGQLPDGDAVVNPKTWDGARARSAHR